MSLIRYLAGATQSSYLRGDSCLLKVGQRDGGIARISCDASVENRVWTGGRVGSRPPLCIALQCLRQTCPLSRYTYGSPLSSCAAVGINVQLVFAPRRLGCDCCHGVHVEAMPWVSDKRQFTHALMVTLATWARILTWKQVAKLFHCSWSTVAAAVDEVVTYGLAHCDLSSVTHIGIDEALRKCGYVYVTNVYDLKRQRLLWSCEGPGGQLTPSLIPCEISLESSGDARTT